jgi:hypothetical protein
MEAVTQDLFLDWKFHPVTKKLFKLLEEDRENMKEGIVNSIFENEEEVKGRCRAISILLDLRYEDMFPPKQEVANEE